MLGCSCSHMRSRRRPSAPRARSIVQPALRDRLLSHGHTRDLSGSPVTHPVPLPCSQTPAEPVVLAMAAFPVLPPHPTRRRLQRFHDFEAATGLQYPLSTLHERRCRRPCKTRFRLAGSASTGRASNPLGHDERFQVTSVLLSRAYPDASWAHVRRPFYEMPAGGSRRRSPPRRSRASPNSMPSRRRSAADRPKHRRACARRSQADRRGLKTWLELQLAPGLAASSTIAEAIRYALSRWQASTRFLDDGRVEIDNNVVERTIRPRSGLVQPHICVGVRVRCRPPLR